jgi:hypothetical protein
LYRNIFTYLLAQLALMKKSAQVLLNPCTFWRSIFRKGGRLERMHKPIAEELQLEGFLYEADQNFLN